jgi:tetratricopeptide (TPR) repeat protein
MKLKKYENAISAFKAVLSLNSTDLEAAARLAEIYYEMGDYVQCEQNMARFEENLSKKNISLLSDQTKKAIEKTVNAFVNYRAVIKGKTLSKQSESSL